ncbi:SET-domain-containing protein [Mycena indigotica]|uniref:SET-domain-containing protein n=1 Tax=Mycena indigotica TaxID=2126181 RepID=A0A8H6S9L4_9AGAR|nr:SET-domain-containing protein [Mycena indigotica]KAF7294848.1 SET-domain-containing protein [Mycena indigotica]
MSASSSGVSQSQRDSDRVLAQNLRHQVLSEFHAWKIEHILKPAKEELEARFPSELEHEKFLSVSSWSRTQASARWHDPPHDDNVIIYHDLLGNSPPQRIDVAFIEAGRPARGEEYIPCPPYRYCAPISASFNAEVDSNSSAQYIPFPDDGTFPLDGYLATFKNCDWLSQGRDGKFSTVTPNPDDELITYETIRRLHYDHGFTEEDINTVLKTVDGMGGRPLRWGFENGLYSDESGFLWESSQRDIPNIIWADGHETATAPRLPPDFGGNVPCADQDLIARLNRNGKKFCPNLNCIMHCCRIHISHDWEEFAQPFYENIPQLTSRDLVVQKQQADNSGPCGDKCFLYALDQREDVDMDIEEASEGRALVQGLLKLQPDLCPCDLATIAGVDCDQAFHIRQAFVSDKDVSLSQFSPPHTPNTGRNKNKHRVPERMYYCAAYTRRFDSPQKQWARPPAAFKFHTRVPATILASAALLARIARVLKLRFIAEERANARQLVQLVCIAGPDATIPARNGDIAGYHPSKQWARRPPQCVPAAELRRSVIRSYARDATQSWLIIGLRRHTTYRPQELQTEKGKTKTILRKHGGPAWSMQVIVKTSKYGYGAFAERNINAGDLIGDYPGELIHDQHMRSEHRGILSTHMGTNYLFALGTGVVVDALSIGNPTRFLNDPKPRAANCVAGEVVVNGQRQIVIHATKQIRKGAELTLSYGEGYWNGSV